VAGAGAGFGRRPVRVEPAGAVAQGRGRDQKAMGRFGDGGGKGPRRIDPVTMHSHIDLAPVDALDAEPVDELLGRFGIQGVQHGPPSGDGNQRPALEAAADGIDPLPRARLQVGRFIVEQRGQG